MKENSRYWYAYMPISATSQLCNTSVTISTSILSESVLWVCLVVVTNYKKGVTSCYQSPC